MQDLKAAVDFGPPHVQGAIVSELRRHGLDGDESVGVAKEGIRHGVTLHRLFSECNCRYLLFVFGSDLVELRGGGLSSLLTPLAAGRAVLTYGAHYIRNKNREESYQPLIDYQIGSVRDDFDFGPLVMIDVGAAREVFKQNSHLVSNDETGWYGFRLALSETGAFERVCEPCYTVVKGGSIDGETEHFRYVDPCQQDYQRRLEDTFTAYARTAGFYLPPRKGAVDFSGEFAVEASIIIPVKNRASTIAEAVESALSQNPPFAFNVIVVDNHSRDGTSTVLADMARKNRRLIHLIPTAENLEIGGCWNEALRSIACGRFAVQLDSDDLYASPHVLETIVAKFYLEGSAAVVGSYRVVDKALREIPPGLVDHREWSAANGHNNALRINGFGAPRAFFTPIARQIGFMNVSYGEDYALMLRLTREYALARIYEALYLCRRWEGNSDAVPSIEKLNVFNFFKDKIRTDEILARKRLNGVL